MGALSVGHLAEELVVLDLEQPHQFVVRLFVPFGEERRIEPLYLGDGHEGVLHVSLQQQSDTRPLPGRHGTRVIAEQTASAGIGFDKPREDIDGRGLAGTILTQQSQDTSTRHREREIFVDQPLPIIMGDVFERNHLTINN